MYFDALPLGTSVFLMGFPCGAGGKESAWQSRRHKRRGFDPWVRKIPGSRKWQPAPVFLPEKPYGQRSLAGYDLWGCKESDTNEATEDAHMLVYNCCIFLME